MDNMLPLMEKYRPTTIVDIREHEFVKKILLRFLECGEMPHLLFYGPPGSGKTSALFALATELFGEYRNHMILELNGSDERGITIIRDKIKQFASIRNLMRPNYPKLIILDEADSMTYDAQFALRRIIEIYTNNVRFCFLCNWENKIIDAIKSRCLVYRFNKLSNVSIESQIYKVIKCEKMFEHVLSESASGTDNTCSIFEISRHIGDVCDGDMRKAYNILEYIRYMKSSSDIVDAIYCNAYGASLHTMEKMHIDILGFIMDSADINITQSGIYKYITRVMIESSIGMTPMIKILVYIAKRHKNWTFMNQLSTMNYRFNRVNCSNETCFVYMLCNLIVRYYI